MWISKQIVKNEDEPISQTGKSTLNSDGSVEVVSTGVNRDVKMYAPFGYSYSLPTGINVLLTQGDGTQTGIGVELDSKNLKSGEIKITSSSGAYIYLKQDGSVVINGLAISKEGVIE
jgi:phage gp45-like